MSDSSRISAILSAHQLTSLDSNATSNCACPESQAPAQTISQAKSLVADYLRDLGLTDPDVIARQSQQIIERAVSESSEADKLDPAHFCETAIRLTVKELENLLALLASRSDCAETPERLGCVVAAQLPLLLKQFPQAMCREELPAELVASLRQALKPVVPTPRPRSMRRQVLVLLPSFVKRAYTRFRNRLFGENC